MAKVWSTLTDGYGNEDMLTEQFINGVAWVRDTTHLLQLKAWYGYHVEGSFEDAPDVLDKATKEETIALCAQYSINMTGKPKWTIIAELREAISTAIPSATTFKYSYDLGKWMENHILH